MITIVGDENVDEVAGKWRVPEWNENSDSLVEVGYACGLRRLVLASTHFPHKMIHK